MPWRLFGSRNKSAKFYEINILTDSEAYAFGRGGEVKDLDVLGLTRRIERKDINLDGIGAHNIHCMIVSNRIIQLFVDVDTY